MLRTVYVDLWDLCFNFCECFASTKMVGCYFGHQICAPVIQEKGANRSKIIKSGNISTWSSLVHREANTKISCLLFGTVPNKIRS